MLCVCGMVCCAFCGFGLWLFVHLGVLVVRGLVLCFWLRFELRVWFCCEFGSLATCWFWFDYYGGAVGFPGHFGLLVFLQWFVLVGFLLVLFGCCCLLFGLVVVFVGVACELVW